MHPPTKTTASFEMCLEKLKYISPSLKLYIYIPTLNYVNSLPGFCRLRMHTKHGHTQQGSSIPVAFVEFKDAACAGSAMVALQGTFLLSSDRGAIRIEYAKSKMAITEPAQHPSSLVASSREVWPEVTLFFKYVYSIYESLS